MYSDRGQDPSARLRSQIRWHDRDFADLVELWNVAYRAYRDHLEPYGALYVRLEDLVDNPHAVLAELGCHLSLGAEVDRAATIEEIRREPAKVHRWECWAGDAAKERYDLANLETLWSPEDLAYIDGRIDGELVARFGYPVVTAGRTVRPPAVAVG